MLEIRRALSATRLLTLTGVGGSGKTRLTVEVGRDLVEAYPDGVWLVELAPLSEEVLVPKAVAEALKVPERPAEPLVLEPVRQYALDKLEESDEAEEARRRHAEFFLGLAEETETEMRGPEQATWLDRLEAEHDNLRGALSWALERGEPELGLHLAEAFWWFWEARGYFDEGRRWLEQALAKGSRVTSARALGPWTG